MFQTPILLITFNRPYNTSRALNAIRVVQPKSLYIFQDGVRDGNVADIERCAKVREVVEELLDWPCELQTCFQNKNLGCGRGPYEAISWFFRHVEEGIILEDDIVPHPLFFRYMEDLLKRYSDNESIGMVTGHNLQRYYSSRHSYYFTYEMAGTLGWGTWRRVWREFDFNIQFNQKELERVLSEYGVLHCCKTLLCANYKRWLSSSRHDCWDYQFDYYLLVNHYLNARANSCLTSHEGDDADATHTGFSNPGYKMSVNVPLFEHLSHPKSVEIDVSVKWRMMKKEIHLIVRGLLARLKSNNDC